MSDTDPVIVWFRQDLRLADNPALATALDRRRPLLLLYILDDDAPGRWAPGGAARWWLHHSLDALRRDIEARGGTLTIRRGPAARVLDEMIAETGARSVLWNRCYEPYAIARDRDIKSALKARGITVDSFNGSLLNEPWTVRTKAGGFYKVYTRYWQSVRAAGDPPPPLDPPGRLSCVTADTLSVPALDLLPTKPDWATGLDARWSPGAAPAMARLDNFLDQWLDGYDGNRDFPARPATSNLSPYLHIGDVSPRQVWHRTIHRSGWTPQTEKFLKELVWREFAYHVFYHLPDLPETPMHSRFADFPWQADDGALAAWQQGRTGYPMVDAGMRELWLTGHMHNRVRMVVGSFLVKHLLLPWQTGQAWFWDTLVDADLAVNAFSWQWIAGCGADAAPYFRIFNPTTQGEKFDPDGTYIRTYVPEIAALPDKYICQPWAAPDDVLGDAGIVLGETYPAPIVDHRFARERALTAFRSLPSSA